MNYECVSFCEREQVEIYLYKLTTDLLMGVINERQKTCGIQLKEEDKRFVADFYKYAFVGLMLEWIRGGMKEEPDQIIKRLSVILQGTLEGCLERLGLQLKARCPIIKNSTDESQKEKQEDGTRDVHCFGRKSISREPLSDLWIGDRKSAGGIQHMELEQLRKDMVAAMKAGDKARKASISNLVSAVKKAAIDEGCREDIPASLVDKVLVKELKTAKEPDRDLPRRQRRASGRVSG